MKLLFASDIHGSASACQRLLARLEAEEADRLFLLGDLLYHGPRNSLPDQYQPQEVCILLNRLTPAPLCVRGNCDAEVDQMVLSFPIMADYALLPLENGCCAFLTHGHLFHQQALPPLAAGDVMIHGHTHVHGAWPMDRGCTYLNPGSAALPKEGQPPSYMVYHKGVFTIKALADGTPLLIHPLHKTA